MYRYYSSQKQLAHMHIKTLTELKNIKGDNTIVYQQRQAMF
jgi:hypothetical protein